jgi:hypothetical protein
MTNTLPQSRIASIDLLKGLVMVIMALIIKKPAPGAGDNY